MLVLDDCHELPDESPVLELFPLLLQEITPGVQVLALSRHQTPPVLARGLANREVVELGAQDLAFTLDETESVLAQPQSSIDKAVTSRLHGVTKGWAAGLVLYKMLLERREFGPNDLNRVVPGRIQEYFETEVIKALPASEAELLIKTAWLPYLTHATAFHVTASPETGDLIARLARKGLFVTEHQQDVPHFSYHPLFHRVLQTLAQHFLSKNDVAAARYRAAQALEDSGDIESAIESWLSLQEFERAAKLIGAQAPKILGQARFATLGRWLKVLSQEVRRKSPWILYWEGMCFGSIKPDVALESFDAAFHLFKNENNLTGMALACCGAMEAIYLDWKDFKRLDPWIEAFEPIYEPWAKAVPPDLALRGAADMLGSLMWRTPDHPRIGQWRELTKSLLHKTEDPTAQGLAMTHLLCFHTWKGELDEAEQLANETIGTSGEATLSPVWIIGRMCFKTIVCWNKGSYDIGENYVTQTLAYACETGVHVADHHILAQGLYNSLLSGDRTRADHYQKQFAAILNPAHPFIEAHFHHLVSWAAWLQGNTDDAWRHSRIALRGAQQAGTPFPIALNHYAQAILAYHRGLPKQASAEIKRALRIGQSMDSALLMYMSLLAKAYFVLDRTEHAGPSPSPGSSTTKRLREQALIDLRHGLTIGREHNLGAHSWWTPHMMSRLCAIALEASIEVPYVRQLIRHTRLAAPDDAIHLTEWPWPVRIFTLGRFGIQCDGKPLQFAGKAQKKPFELLKVLIALGGRKVSDTLVADALWPDAEGDAAYRALITTVQRLRRMLNEPEAVHHTEGTLTLNPHLCWVDAWAFERTLNQTKNDPASFEPALRLYQGTFLGNEADAPWADRMRQRLRDKFLRAATGLCQQKVRRQSWEEARACYERALEVDPHREELYQGLILCLTKLEQRTEALSAYRRCRAMLASQFGLSPSRKTEELYESLRAE